MERQPRITLVELPPTSFGKLNGRLVKDIYTRFRLPARANPLLYSILLREGYGDVESIDPNWNRGRKLTKRNLGRIGESDYLLLSAITRTIQSTRELAINYKKINPKGKVIVGGPHVTFLPEEALEWADVVVRNEGDETLVELLERLVREESLENVRGISYKLDGEIINEEDRELLDEGELSSLPAPDYSIYSKRTRGVLNTSRGCPYDCDFCSITQLYGREYRRKSNGKILEELDSIGLRVKHIFFSDDNFSVKKQETKELLKELIKKKKRDADYSCQLSVNSAFISLRKNDVDEEFLHLLKEANFFGVYLGIESINDETLKSYNKPATAERNKLAVEAFRNAGLWTHGMMMVGGDGDTEESLDETLEWTRNSLDSVQFFAPGPLPKTRFTEEMIGQGRILAECSQNFYYLYDGLHVLVEPKNFSPYELQMKNINMHKGFYNFKDKSRIKKSPYPWHKRAIDSYAKKVIWDIEHEPQTIAHIKFLRSLE